MSTLTTIPFSNPYLISHEGSNELHGLLKGVRGVGASVQDESAEIDVGQKIWVSVDLTFQQIILRTTIPKKLDHLMGRQKYFVLCKMV